MRSTPARISSNCLRAYSPPTIRSQKSIALRTFSSHSPLAAGKATSPSDEDEDAKQNVGQEEGAMSRRLSEMVEETMDTGSKSDRKLMQDAGFSEELKKKLEERIAQTAFQAENQQAFSEVNMPVCFTQHRTSIYTSAMLVFSPRHLLSTARAQPFLRAGADAIQSSSCWRLYLLRELGGCCYHSINLSRPAIAVPDLAVSNTPAPYADFAVFRRQRYTRPSSRTTVDWQRVTS
jgi:hypothetical protein